ncbi:hypothetical protein BDN72DRAFT_310973 [Pluteus cervinus]|uniref:Uncharacterized protein n=1 Tax=Pluteus cervinus TaxID=181527 RepID=A0ACD3ACS7_9AGAR|nr:hypothetical protein BDN72DRAFT_310973 [Pluteus cervinus]
MIKKRTRPQLRVREKSQDAEDNEVKEKVEEGEEEEEKLPLADIIQLRKLRKGREGIDATKLTVGDAKKKKKQVKEEDKGGLRPGTRDLHEEDDEEDPDAKARRVVRANNFTQQTNTLDVDKHMMAYIEENLQIRSRPREDDDEDKAFDPQEALYDLSQKYNVNPEKQKVVQEGSVTNSMTMLTAIPEVDLGMDARLKNIEETEKAKREVAEGRQDRKRPNPDEEHLVASRFYRPNLKTKSDADIMRDAKLEAMGLSSQEDHPARRHDNHRPQMATDEMVMERFKKRMRK